MLCSLFGEKYKGALNLKISSLLVRYAVLACKYLTEVPRKCSASSLGLFKPRTESR